MVINPPKIGIAVLNYNSPDDTLACLEALRRVGGGERRVWVADNASTDDSAQRIPPRLLDNEVWLPTGANLGYAGGNNAAIREALRWGAVYVLVLNPDCAVDEGFLQPLVRALEAVPKAGIACALSLDAETGKVQSFGGRFSLWTGRAVRRFYGANEEAVGAEPWAVVDFPLGDCMLFKRAFLEEAGLLNDAYFLYYEDVEIGLRARREGWKTLAIRRGTVRHRDTTASRTGDPVVSFYGTRNQAWVVAEYGSFLQRMCYLFLSCYARWPWRFLVRLARGKVRAALAVARGGWAGQTSKAWQTGDHLAVPIQGRPLKVEPLP